MPDALLSLSRGVFWCTSNGALAFASGQSECSSSMLSSEIEKASLPKRLQTWQLASDASSFCYGGDEVDLSVWNTERAFSGKLSEGNEVTETKKRKRGDELFPGEVWRAKNVCIHKVLQ